MDLDRAEFCADAWARTQELPKGWYFSRAQRRQKNWHFKARCKLLGNDGPIFDLLLFAVSGEGAIVDIVDRRPKIARLSVIGFERETRFFRVISEHTERTPDWYLGCKRTCVSLDKQGLDGFAKISVGVDQHRTIKLPFQIKSSEKEAESYFVQYPQMRGVVMMIVVKDNYSDDELRQLLYSAAEPIRNMILRGECSVDEFKRRITVSIYGDRS